MKMNTFMKVFGTTMNTFMMIIISTTITQEYRQRNPTPILINTNAYVTHTPTLWISTIEQDNAVGVAFGAILGHTICTVVAVMGGRLIAGRISERMVTGIGGLLFLIFAVVAIWEGA